MQRLREAIATILKAYKAQKLLRRTRRELYALSDHRLRDIGLRRDQIPYLDRRS